MLFKKRAISYDNKRSFVLKELLLWEYTRKSNTLNPVVVHVLVVKQLSGFLLSTGEGEHKLYPIDLSSKRPGQPELSLCRVFDADFVQ